MLDARVDVASALLPFALLVALVVGCGWAARVLPPRLATTLLTAASLVAALAVGAVLSLFGFLFVLRTPPGIALLHISPSDVARHDPLPDTLSLIAGVAAIALFCCGALRAGLMIVRLVRSAAVCRDLPAGESRLVIVDDGPPAAFALPGLPGRAVVTASLLRELTPRERAIVLAHECSHLSHHHEIYLELTRVAVAANPLLTPVERAVALAIERWADEDAVSVSGDPAHVARALARVGLLTKGTHYPARAFAAAGSEIRARIETLGTTSRTAHAATCAVAAALLCVLAVSGAVEIVLWGHALVEQAQAAIGYFG